MISQPELGQRIREARKKAGTNITFLAHLIGIKQQSLSDIESGSNKPRKPTLDSICRSLSLNPDTLEPITRSLWDEIEAMCEICDDTPLWPLLEEYQEELKRIPSKE